jgi:hypothetical protein
MKRIGLLCSVALVLSGCAGDSGKPSPVPSASGQEAFTAFLDGYYRSLTMSGSLAAVTIPVLKSPSFETKWGAPRIRTSASGNYELSYANPNQPFDRLVIQGSSAPFPALKEAPMMSGEKMINDELTPVDYPQEFRTVPVSGRTVRWYQDSLSGGADGAYYATEGFALTDSKGQTGYYRMMVESGDNAHAEVARRFATAVLTR